MKKTYLILILAIFCIGIIGTPAIADNGIKIYINDELRTVDPEPFIENGRTYVPIRFIAENFGAAVD